MKHFNAAIRPVLLPGFLLLALQGTAQRYTNASANLPDNGAKGASMDVQTADLDGDGDLDIVLANEFQSNTILLNNGSGIFSNGTVGNLPQIAHDSEDVAIADFDGDGDLDLIFCSEDDVTHGWTNVHEFYLNDGAGKFVAADYKLLDSEANAVISTDLNGDERPDLIFGNNGLNSVLVNTGNAGFALESNRLPPIVRTTQDLALADVDGDGDLDLFEGNENGNLLLLNDGMGHFADVTATHLPGGLNIETRKVCFGDVDGDGDPDIFLSNVGFIPGKNRQNRLFLNDGTGKFSDATATHLPADNDHTIDAIFEDVDLDGDLDLVVANVFGAALKIYENDGAGKFIDATTANLGQHYVLDALGVIAADLNGDGLRDLYVCDRFQPSTNRKDLLLLRSPVTAVADAEDVKSSVTIYPNPVRDHFFVQTTLKGIDSVQVESPQGQLLASLATQSLGNGLFRCAWPSTKPASGVYLLRIGGIRKRVFVMP